MADKSAEKIQNGKVVDLSYELTNSKGEVLDKSTAKDPFTYLHGAEQIVEGLEAALLGLKVGDKKKVSVPPELGYGELNPELKLVVNRSQFPADAEIEQGMRFRANSPEGHDMVFAVEKIVGDEVHIDGNHELAGQTLNFDVEVLSMREATEEEKQHGHAHGPHGHGDHGDHGGHTH
jgi:FKBP-type peptidyl-prolyl cis-trans isomerase SlyD